MQEGKPEKLLQPAPINSCHLNRVSTLLSSLSSSYDRRKATTTFTFVGGWLRIPKVATKRESEVLASLCFAAVRGYRYT